MRSSQDAASISNHRWYVLPGYIWLYCKQIPFLSISDSKNKLSALFSPSRFHWCLISNTLAKIVVKYATVPLRIQMRQWLYFCINCTFLYDIPVMNRSDRAQSRRSGSNGRWTSLQKLHILRIDQLGWAAKRQGKRNLAVLKNRVGHFLVLRFRQADLSANVLFVVWMPVSAHETNKISHAGPFQMNCEGTGTHACLSSLNHLALFCTFPRQVTTNSLLGAFLLLSSKFTAQLAGSPVL